MFTLSFDPSKVAVKIPFSLDELCTRFRAIGGRIFDLIAMHSKIQFAIVG